jgi:hypothetical protein
MDRKQLIVCCATAAFYQELATSLIMKNRRQKRRTITRTKQLNVRKTVKQDKDKVKAVELQIAV